MNQAFIVAADAPCVQGHFAEAPVVPGAWLLGRVHAYLSAVYPGHPVESIKKAKFPAPLLPGERVEIAVDDSRWPRLGVVLNTQKGMVLEAQVNMGAGDVISQTSDV